MDQPTSPFWSVPAAQVLKDLQTAAEGLSAAEAVSRLERYAARRLAPKKRTDFWKMSAFFSRMNMVQTSVDSYARQPRTIITDRTTGRSSTLGWSAS